MRSSLALIVLLTLTVALWIGAAVSAQTPWGALFDNAHWTLSALGGTALAWAAARRSQKGSTGRVLRLGTAAALGLYTVGQLIWDVETLLGSPHLVMVSTTFFLLMGPAMSLALFQSWRVRQKGKATGIHLDATLMTLGIMVLCLAFYLPLNVGNLLDLLVFLLYPVTLFGSFSLGLVLALHDQGRVQPGRLATMAILLATSFTWMFWNLGIMSGGQPNGSVINLSFSVLMLTLAASVSSWSWSRRTGARGWKAGTLILLPLVGPVAGSVGLVVAVANHSMPPVYIPFFIALAAILLVLSLVRQWTLFRDLKLAQLQRERNSQLEVALAELRRTQGQLVQSAKLTALGQLIAGITHDLNSPLGAIRSSSSLLQTVLKEQAHQSFHDYESLDADHRAVYGRLSEALSPDLSFLDSRAERALKRQIVETFENAGHDQPEDLASVLVEAGLAGREELVAELVGLKRPGAVVGALQTQAVANRLASVILQATDRASKVVVSLHNFLRGGAEGEKTWVVIAESIEAVLPLFEHRRKQGLRLTTAFQAEAVVLGWPDKLTQVWVNLITNAAQAVAADGSIDIGLRVDGREVEVTVADDGPGIPAAEKEKIFQAFFTTKAAGEGSGLGLEVCRRVVEELGGSISLESKPGRTVFTVRLPLADEMA